jgi:hypothetical protein
MTTEALSQDYWTMVSPSTDCPRLHRADQHLSIIYACLLPAHADPHQLGTAVELEVIFEVSVSAHLSQLRGE